MKLYCGIDLHSNNSVISVINENDRVVHEKRLPNELPMIVMELSPYREEIEGVAVESTFNWYWLVDGLVDNGHRVHLVNTAAVKQYEGLKYSDDQHDARWLAHLLRLGILPQGYICPREHRAVRDLLRKRSQMVRQQTANILSVQNLLMRNTGHGLKAHEVKKLDSARVDELLGHPLLSLAVQSNVGLVQYLHAHIRELECVIKEQVRLSETFKLLKTASGIGDILALTIMLEVGEIGRFAKVGQYASYCRCVASKRLSNGKKKGEGNRKNGNKFLAWAYVEAANFAVRYSPRIKRFYQKKKAKTNGAIAIKAVAHKLARATYYVMRDQVAFDEQKAFA